MATPPKKAKSFSGPATVKGRHPRGGEIGGRDGNPGQRRLKAETTAKRLKANKKAQDKDLSARRAAAPSAGRAAAKTVGKALLRASPVGAAAVTGFEAGKELSRKTRTPAQITMRTKGSPKPKTITMRNKDKR